MDESRNTTSIQRLSDDFNRPVILEQNDNLPCLARGMASQAAQAVDRNYDTDIRELLFKRNNIFGDDLKARDIQRGNGIMKNVKND